MPPIRALVLSLAAVLALAGTLTLARYRGDENPSQPPGDPGDPGDLPPQTFDLEALRSAGL